MPPSRTFRIDGAFAVVTLSYNSPPGSTPTSGPRPHSPRQPTPTTSTRSPSLRSPTASSSVFLTLALSAARQPLAVQQRTRTGFHAARSFSASSCNSLRSMREALLYTPENVFDSLVSCGDAVVDRDGSDAAGADAAGRQQ